VHGGTARQKPDLMSDDIGQPEQDDDGSSGDVLIYGIGVSSSRPRRASENDVVTNFVSRSIPW